MRNMLTEESFGFLYFTALKRPQADLHDIFLDA